MGARGEGAPILEEGRAGRGQEPSIDRREGGPGLGEGARPEQEDIPPFVYALGSRRGVGDVVTPFPLTNTRTGQQLRSEPGIDCPKREFLPFFLPFANRRENGSRSRSSGLRTGPPFGLPF